jgi:Family of unknown function (DUF6325)
VLSVRTVPCGKDGGGVVGAAEVGEYGPVDYVVVEFPAGQSRFTGEMAAALTELVARGLVRVLDLLIVRKNDDGSFEPFELADLDDREVGELRAFEKNVAELLAEDDVAAIAAAMEPGSIAGVVVWENAWAAPFASAVRRAGASWWPAAGSRSRRSWLRSETSRPIGKERDMPLGRGRVGRPGVIGAPVARTAAVVGTAAVVSHGVGRRQDRRDDRRDDRQDRRDDRRDRR